MNLLVIFLVINHQYMIMNHLKSIYCVKCHDTAFCPKNGPRPHPHSLFQCVIPRCFVTQRFIM